MKKVVPKGYSTGVGSNFNVCFCYSQNLEVNPGSMTVRFQTCSSSEDHTRSLGLDTQFPVGQHLGLAGGCGASPHPWTAGPGNWAVSRLA